MTYEKIGYNLSALKDLKIDGVIENMTPSSDTVLQQIPIVVSQATNGFFAYFVGFLFLILNYLRYNKIEDPYLAYSNLKSIFIASGITFLFLLVLFQYGLIFNYFAVVRFGMLFTILLVWLKISDTR